MASGAPEKEVSQITPSLGKPTGNRPEVDVHGKADRHMKLLTIETESRLGTLWDQEQCMQLCSRDELWEPAKEEEMKIPWKAANEESPILEEQYQERF